MSDAQHFEAINYSLRKTKDGVVVAFVVQPHDVTPELMALPVGARVMIAWSQIGDDERQIGGGEPSTSVSGQKGADREAVPIAVPDPKERKPFNTLPLAQQCAMRCEERRFRDFIKEIEPDNFAIANGDVASVVRGYLMLSSRAELGKGNHDADRAWRQLERLYQAYITDQQYAESRRP